MALVLMLQISRESELVLQTAAGIETLMQYRGEGAVHSAIA